MRLTSSFFTLTCVSIFSLTQAFPIDQEAQGQGVSLSIAERAPPSTDLNGLEVYSKRNKDSSESSSNEGSKSELTLTGSKVKLELCEGITQKEFEDWEPFKEWWSRFQHNLQVAPAQKKQTLQKLSVTSVVHKGPKGPLLFLFTSLVLLDAKKQADYRSIFFRGPAVGMLVILQADNVPKGSDKEKYVVLTTQARVAAGSLDFTEIPAGMVDPTDKSFSVTASRETMEELELHITAEEMINLSEIAAKGSKSNEKLPVGMFPSVGGMDEYIQLFVAEKRLPAEKIKSFQNKHTGLKEENEVIVTKLVKLEDLWKEGASDAKALSALALYNGWKNSQKSK